jgi:hypothetical protein
MQLQPSTWRVLGLSVAAGYAGFGVIATFFPQRAAAEFFGISTISDKKEPVASQKAIAPPPQDVEQAVSVLAPLLGARDLTIAAALFAYHFQGKTREMGTLVLAGNILCAADVFVVWKTRGPAL